MKVSMNVGAVLLTLLGLCVGLVIMAFIIFTVINYPMVMVHLVWITYTVGSFYLVYFLVKRKLIMMSMEYPKNTRFDNFIRNHIKL